MHQRDTADEYILYKKGNNRVRYHFKRVEQTAYLSAITDKYGHRLNVVYDNHHRLIALQPQQDKTRRLAFGYYDKQSILIDTVTIQILVEGEWQTLHPLMHYHYNDHHQLIGATNAAGQTETYEYDALNVIQKRTMAGGAEFNWVWEGEGQDVRCLRQWGNFGQLDERYTWQDENVIVTMADGSQKCYTHKDGLLQSETDANGATKTYQYNEEGLKTVEIDALGHQTHYEYTVNAELKTIIYPDNSYEDYTWQRGRIIRIEKNGLIWRIRYNHHDDIIELETPDGLLTRHRYNEDGQRLSTQYPDGSEQHFTWGDNGELQQLGFSDGRLFQFSYDALLRLTVVSDGQQGKTYYTYDDLGQITKITYPNNTTREYQYNAYGKVTWFKDEAGKVTEYDYASPLHLMTEKRLPDGERLKFRYDNIHLQISEIENQKGERYRFSYTPTGQLSEEIGFDEVKTTYHYDLNGYLIEKHEYGNQHDEKPLITRYQRDSRGKLIVKELADGIKEHYSYNQNGLLTQILDGQSVLGWEYNEVGRLTAEHQNWATIRHRYDENTGLLNGSKLPDGQWLEYYHIHGQLRGMTLDGQSLIGLLYDNAGRECERRQGNGLVNRYQYDPLGQLIAHQRYHGYDISTQTSPTPIWQQQYHYNPNGQLAEITGHQPRCYRYDNAGQLHTVTYPEANPEQHHAEKVEQFDYDSTGNKISETQALAPTPFHSNIAKGNRLTFFSDKHFEYDRFGNLIAEKRGKDHRLVTHYQYDCRHRLIKVIKPTGLIITYTYDAFNRRTSKTVDGKTTEFIWQGSRLIAETDNDKHWQSYLYELDSYRPLALVHGNAQQDNIKLYWYQNDHLGTPIALTGSLGDTLYECQYNAYGQIINETYHQDDTQTLPDNPLRFQGQYYDEETGLHYNLNRYYDPFTGRYITQDPLGILGGLNSYQYVNGDPINWIDPLGLIKIENNGLEGIAGKDANSNVTQSGIDKSADFSRPLTPSDLGVKGTLSELDGTFSVNNGTATVRIDMIRGEINNPLRIVNNLIDLAKANGVTTLKIEGTIANPKLYNVLQKRYGLTSHGANDIIIIKLK
ncbi:hypothetical protein A9G29_11470 [Gilliamella sp. Fer2-1]|nr:hypothetical protein A9G29_11470 [Gilliamella apicola]